jgi:hypothetical protein
MSLKNCVTLFLATALAFVAAAVLAVPLLHSQSTDYDVLITNGHVIDGTGSPWYAADVAIRGDRIAWPSGTWRLVARRLRVWWMRRGRL